jgi:hypothetical protein
MLFVITLVDIPLHVKFSVSVPLVCILFGTRGVLPYNIVHFSLSVTKVVEEDALHPLLWEFVHCLVSRKKSNLKTCSVSIIRQQVRAT